MATKEYKYTADDLKAMQSWSLTRKIGVTQTRIIEFYTYFRGKVYICLSGGKDSTVLLDLARRCYPNIEAVFCDTGLEFNSVRKFALSHKNVRVVKPEMRFDEVIDTDTYGWCYPSKDVAYVISSARNGAKWAIDKLNGVYRNGIPNQFRQDRYGKWKYLLDSSVKISDKCCGVMKEKPLRKYEAESGKHAIVGTLANESQRRKQSWYVTGCNSFGGTKKSRPLSFWTEQDILRYLRDYHIPYADVYGDIVEDKHGKLRTTGEKRTGCLFCPIACHLEKPNKFQRLEITNPKLYDYVMNKLNLRELLDFAGVNYGMDSKKSIELSRENMT